MRLDASADTTKIHDWINQRYAQICVEAHANVPSSATMTLTSGVAEYTFPTTVERILAMYVTPSGGTRSGPLEATSIEDIIERSSGTTSSSNQGWVTRYALLGINEFVVWPTPQSADTLTIYYVGLPTALANDSDVPILHEPWASRLLFYGAAADAASFRGDAQGQEYAVLFENWLGRYRTHLNRKKGATTRQFRIVGDQMRVPHDRSMDSPLNGY